ncbi:transcriptional regulator, TetR family [Acidimicrobium ferrooxidans DSM 10331]|uniref:Transcriptional regulator, TetR family n=1 Tax=Acidimicrobium ferrooxidans (strain DSM 10331 / JCM 15462 / NBRC 103882 / ICP) TaxID=525909 RepID=C7M2Q4_ACIFD|nr:TetR/AcrR family transcriptional regulator [Acidimicrobium ferrooxidans]ACU53298.1 transcriptional regulator, TetR family [Acidimicrobium ferrooxidans DSM 10331]
MQADTRAHRLPAERRRALILDAARTVFAQRGFESASMDEVARHARVTKPVIYQHFASKRALFREVIDGAGAELARAIAEATRGVESPRVRLWSGIRAFFAFVHAHRAAYLVLFGPGVYRDVEFQSIVVGIELAIADLVAESITGAPSESDRLLTARALIGLANGAAAAYIDDVDDDEPNRPFEASLAARYAERTAALAWAGLRHLGRSDVATTESSAPLTLGAAGPEPGVSPR